MIRKANFEGKKLEKEKPRRENMQLEILVSEGRNNPKETGVHIYNYKDALKGNTGEYLEQEKTQEREAE